MRTALRRFRAALITTAVVAVTAGSVAAPAAVAEDTPPASAPSVPPTDRAKVAFVWKFGGPVSQADAAVALAGTDADVTRFLTTQLSRDSQVDHDVRVNQIMAAGDSATRSAGQRALDAGTDSALTDFLDTGWEAAYGVDLRVRVNQVFAAGGSQVKAAAQRALDDGSSDTLAQFLAAGWRSAFELNQRLRVNQAMAAGGPEVQAVAQQALDAGTVDAYTQFLGIDLPVAQARDAETADITQLAATAANAASQAATETQAAKDASDRAVAEAAAAQAAAQAAKDAAAAAQGHSEQATDAAGRAAFAAQQAAATARQAIGAANAASSAANAAASAASRAAAAAAAAGRAASNAYDAAALAVGDKTKAADAKFAAQVARDAANAASTAANAADWARTASQQAGIAGSAASDAAGRSVAAANAATEAADNAAAAGADASVAKAAAARARAEAARAVAAANASRSWANQAADQAGIAAGAARAAGTDATNAAAAAEDAAAHAGEAANAAQKATEHANAASAAATTAVNATNQATQIATAARQADADRIALAGQQADDAAREAVGVAASIPAAPRRDADQASTWDAETNRMIAEAADPGTARATAVADARKVAMKLGAGAGPWTRAAAVGALGQPDDQVLEFVRHGLAAAAGQDDRTILTDLTTTGTSAFTTAATAALAGSDTAVRDFLRGRDYPGREQDDRIQVDQVMAAARADGRTTVVTGGQRALDAGGDTPLRQFLEAGQYTAAASDDRVRANQIMAAATSSGSRELAATAQAALDGPAQLLQQFLSVGQFTAARRDQNTAAHYAAIDSLLAQAAKSAADATHNADDAQAAAARARNAAQEAADYANQAATAASQAAGYANQAQTAAAQAANSAQQAQHSAATAAQAAASAVASADRAGRSALSAEHSAQLAAGYAQQASASARIAFDAAVQAGKDAGAAADAARQAWQTVVTKANSEKQKVIDDRTTACQNRSQNGGFLLSTSDCILLVTGTDADRERIFGKMQDLCRRLNEGADDLVNRCLDPNNMWDPNFNALPDPAAAMAAHTFIGPPGEGAALEGLEELIGIAEEGAEAITVATEASKLAAAVNEAATSERLLGEDAGLAEDAERLARMGPCGRNSFTGDTPVLMADGSAKPIEDVVAGDRIANAAPESPVAQQHAVDAVVVTDDDTEFTDVTVATPGGPETIKTTAHHPFWDATARRWTDAAQVRPGDALDTVGGQHVGVLANQPHGGTVRTYNLTIDTLHTYYVLAGATPVLVHNTGELCDINDFRAGDEFYHRMSTAQGDVEMLSGISTEGTTLTLSDVAVYGTDGLERGALDSGAVLRELRTVIQPAAKAQGFTELRITGVRRTGPVGHTVDIVIDLTK